MFIEKSRLRSIRDLSFPLMGGLVAQNLMSLIDTAMVGRLGSAALASIGVSNFLFFLIASMVLGIGAGVQAIVARRVGAGEAEAAGFVLNAGILVGTVAGCTVAAAGYLLLPYLYPLVNQDPDVIREGMSYLNPLLLAMPFMGTNVSFRSYWTGMSLPKWSLVSIIVAVAVNIVFNYLLIFGNHGFPRLGTAGAGWATTIAAVMAFLTHLTLGLRLARKSGFLKGLPERITIKRLILISIPESLRSFYLFLGIVAFLAIVGMLGTQELAAFNIILNIMLVAILPAIGMGLAAVTLVGQALGRKDPGDAKKWGWEVAVLGASALLVGGLGMVAFPEAIVRVFTPDPKIMELAVVPLQILGLYLWLEAFGRILGSALVGAGATKVVMIWSVLIQWFISLPLTWLVGVYLGYGLVGIFAISFLVVVVSTSIFSYHWHKERWSLIQV